MRGKRVKKLRKLLNVKHPGRRHGGGPIVLPHDPLTDPGPRIPLFKKRT